jgi:non-specific serine/threonine protein kinase
VAPDFALTEENGVAAVEICRRLDGLPLAIELAAVRLQSMTAADLLERLDDRLRLLASGGGRQLERHRALRATVEWSHDLLGAEERILWRRLSVFSGSFDIDAAETVCSDAQLRGDRIVDALGRLVDSSILTMAHSERRGRYRLLETMRVYGAERLREAGEEAEFRRRHAIWCAELLAPGGRPWWRTGAQADLIDLLDVEWPNVEAALDFCAGSPVDALLGMRMAAEAWPYWVVRGRYGMGRRRLETYLDLLPEPNPSRAMALWCVGFLAQATADHDVALAVLEEAREIGVQTGAGRETAYSLVGLALVRLRVGELAAAVELLLAARETLLALDDPAQSLCLYYLATALAAGGQTADALERAREGLEVEGLEPDTTMGSLLETLLGTLHWMLGDEVAAETALKQAVRVQHRLGHRFGLANSFDGLAWVAASAGSLERASLLLGAVASLWKELGIVPVPFWQSHRDACEAAVREGLIEATYEKCWNQGFALDREEQVALALDEALPPPKHARETKPSDSFELSARELEVARLVARGLSNPAIAATLFLSVATVKTHVSHILRKLALDSRVQLASWLAAHDPGAATADR